MLSVDNTKVVGWEEAIRGMRNPMNSWERSDSIFEPALHIGDNDYNLMLKLANEGPVHAKFRRMIIVYVDIIAPLYWWKEFDTYKVGTVMNSCSTMHKIAEKEFTQDDFSCEHLSSSGICTEDSCDFGAASMMVLLDTIHALNSWREEYLKTKDKNAWWQIIQLLPSSYNQRRTVMMNYEVLAGLYPMRKNHKLDEWHEFCHWIERLPYSKIITTDKDSEFKQIQKRMEDDRK